MVPFYACAGRLTDLSGGFRPGQEHNRGLVEQATANVRRAAVQNLGRKAEVEGLRAECARLREACVAAAAKLCALAPERTRLQGQHDAAALGRSLRGARDAAKRESERLEQAYLAGSIPEHEFRGGLEPPAGYLAAQRTYHRRKYLLGRLPELVS